MLITFFVSDRQFSISLVNGMTVSQFLDRLSAADVPLRLCYQQGIATQVSGQLTERIREAKRDWQWRNLLQEVVDGNVQLAA